MIRNVYHSRGLTNVKLLYIIVTVLNKTKQMTTNVVTESGGRQNMYPTEPRPYIDETVSYDGYPQNLSLIHI